MYRPALVTISFILLALVIFLVLYYVIESQKKKKKNNKAKETPPSDLSPVPPKPTTHPQGKVFAAIGNWPVPFEVRYAVQYVSKSGKPGPLSDWSPWYSSNYYSNNVLSQFPFAGINPNDPGSPATILLWRQFRGRKPRLVARLPYPYKHKYTDMVPNTD